MTCESALRKHLWASKSAILNQSHCLSSFNASSATMPTRTSPVSLTVGGWLDSAAFCVDVDVFVTRGSSNSRRSIRLRRHLLHPSGRVVILGSGHDLHESKGRELRGEKSISPHTPQVGTNGTVSRAPHSGDTKASRSLVSHEGGPNPLVAERRHIPTQVMGTFHPRASVYSTVTHTYVITSQRALRHDRGRRGLCIRQGRWDEDEMKTAHLADL